MCALFHEGVGGPATARIRLQRDPFDGISVVHACRQCDRPECYLACPLPGEAFVICERTGARHVDAEACIGCGECVDACPFEPPRVDLDAETDIARKCDLCREREGGPACVAYCPVDALRFVSREERE
jgi:electron transport protein HydN